MAEVDVLESGFVQLVTGVAGAEGPVWDTAGNFYLVAPGVKVDGKPAGQVLRYDFNAKQTIEVCSPSVDGYGGIPAGCQSDKQGLLWVADMRLGLLTVSSDGTYKQICRNDSAGDCMQGCNDCSFDYDGNLWITAPAGDIAPSLYRRSSKEPFGSVYCYIQGNEMKKVATGIYFPNGIAVQHSADGQPKILIVAETHTKSLWAFDIKGPGQVDNKRLWGKLPGDHEGGPDGMDFDAVGNLLVANWGGGHIEVFPPQGGTPCCRIKCPFSKISNLHFRPNSSEVFVTEHDNNALWTYSWKHLGRKEYCEV